MVVYARYGEQDMNNDGIEKDSFKINVMKDLKSTQRLRTSVASLARNTEIESSLNNVKKQLTKSAEKLIQSEMDREIERRSRHDEHHKRHLLNDNHRQNRFSYVDQGINK